MNIILFSRKQVNHNPEQLNKLFSTMQRLGLNYTINEDFATAVENLLCMEIPRSRRYDGYVEAMGGDVMVPYGGDGTLLEAVQLLPSSDIPVVGINCGRLGYLTADNGEGIEELLERISKGNISYQRRDMLRVSGDVSCGSKCLALNEVAIHRHGATMISIETFIDDNRIATYHGDGLVISTPTGSTAYSLSAGGPVVDPLCNCFILSPIAPHNLTMRPVVVPNNITITLRLHSRGGEAFLSADNRTFTLYDGATIRLQRAEEQLILATPHNNTFYDTLREKMMWGVDNR
jgi:NAD+ kinase